MTQDKERFLERIRGYGVTSDPVLSAMQSVPRERFVRADLQALAYRDAPLPIGEGQTISQPSLVARMTQELNIDQNSIVLEIGTGCGYQTAVLAAIAKRVYTVEVRPDLSSSARRTLDSLGIQNVEFKVGDGREGWSEHAPFDAIIVTAAAREFPETLFAQLKRGGVMILPLEEDGEDSQTLVRITNRGGAPQPERLFPVRFVPIVGPRSFI